MSQAADIFRTPDERFSLLPGYSFAPRYHTFEGQRIHYVDEGAGQPCLLLHGEPTWSYLYRKVIPVLTRSGLRAVAPDYLGFGRSDKPTSLSAYSYERHVQSMKSLIEALDLKNIVLVVHDWGGPIGLRLATLAPQRIAKLVILNTGLYTRWLGLTTPMRQWREAASGISDPDPAQFVTKGCVSQPPLDVLKAYRAPFPDRASKAGVRAFPMLIPASDEDPGAREMLETVHHIWERRWPALVLWGEKDPLFPPSVGEYFCRLFAGASFNKVAGAGHFVPEDKGPEIAEQIVQFVRSHW